MNNNKIDKIIKELKNKLEKHIKFCEQESNGSLNNYICHISLKFEKNLLEEIKKIEEELEKILKENEELNDFIQSNGMLYKRKD